MKKAVVRCRCGHQVLAREVLRTDLYERSMGREYVYVKFRCRRCKRIGEAFVSESRWDWSILEPSPGEMSVEERDRFLDAEAISDADVSAFHNQLESLSRINELAAESGGVAPKVENSAGETPADEPVAPADKPAENSPPRPEKQRPSHNAASDETRPGD
jgi:hypothetical protein